MEHKGENQSHSMEMEGSGERERVREPERNTDAIKKCRTLRCMGKLSKEINLV